MLAKASHLLAHGQADLRTLLTGGDRRSLARSARALALIEAFIAYVGKDTATQPLLTWYKYGFGSVVLWFIFGPFWSLFLVRRGAR